LGGKRKFVASAEKTEKNEEKVVYVRIEQKTRSRKNYKTYTENANSSLKGQMNVTFKCNLKE